MPFVELNFANLSLGNCTNGNTIMKKTLAISQNSYISSLRVFTTIFLLLLLCSFLNTQIHGQSINWQRAYDDPNHDYEGAYTLSTTGNDNVYLCGYVGFIPTYGYVIRINSLGDTIWSKVFGQVSSIISSMDAGNGAFLASGYGGSLKVMKLDGQGGLNWQTSLSGNYCFQLSKGFDTSYYLGCGNANGMRAYIFKLRTDGSIVWERIYSSSYSLLFRSIVPSSNSSNIVCGSLSESASDTGKGYLAEIADSGNILWEKKFVGGGKAFKRVTKLSNSYVLAGTKFDTLGSGFTRSFIMVVDLSGNVTKYKEVLSNGNDETTNDFVLLSPNRYLLLQTKLAFNTFSRIFLFDSNLVTVNQVAVNDSRGSTLLNSAISLQNSTFGSIIIAGSTTVLNNHDDFYAIRTDSNLNIGPPIAVENISTKEPTRNMIIAYPNPFNSETELTIMVNKKSRYQLKLYDTVGRLILDLFDENLDPGTHRINRSFNKIASGVFFCVLIENGKTVYSIKLLFIK